MWELLFTFLSFFTSSPLFGGPNLYYGIPGPSGSSFVNPTSLSGLTLWIDGQDPAGTGTPPAGGSTVTVLKDKSPAGYTFTEAQTAGTYNTTALNSLPAYKYPASGNAWLLSNNTTAAIVPYQQSAMTMFVAYVRTSITTNDTAGDYIMRFNAKISPSFAGHLSFPSAANTTQIAIHDFTPTVTIGIALASPLNTPHIVSFNYNGSGATSAANWAMTLDGSTVTTINDGVGDGDSPTNGIGAPGGGRAFRGALGDVIVYNRSLNGTEMAQVALYLHNKWGI